MARMLVMQNASIGARQSLPRASRAPSMAAVLMGSRPGDGVVGIARARVQPLVPDLFGVSVAMGLRFPTQNAQTEDKLVQPTLNGRSNMGVVPMARLIGRAGAGTVHVRPMLCARGQLSAADRMDRLLQVLSVRIAVSV